MLTDLLLIAGGVVLGVCLTALYVLLWCDARDDDALE
jgi:uncharacterized protein involved in exopolysaccharide biosynthesis